MSSNITFSGTGIGLTYSSSIVVLGYNFDRSRNLASGLVASGSGIGTFLVPIIWRRSFTKYGISGAFLMIGAFAFHASIAGILFRPSKTELQHKMTTPCSRRSRRKSPESGGSRLCTNYSFWLFCVSIFCWSLGVSSVYLHLPTYAKTNGISDSDASFVISIVGIVSIIGRIMTGLAAHSVDVEELILYSGNFGITGLATCLLPLFADTYAGFVVYVVIFGMYSGGVYALLLTITMDIVGIENLSNAFGVEMIFCGTGYLIGPPLSGKVAFDSASHVSHQR